MTAIVRYPNGSVESITSCNKSGQGINSFEYAWE